MDSATSSLMSSQHQTASREAHLKEASRHALSEAKHTPLFRDCEWDKLLSRYSSTLTTTLLAAPMPAGTPAKHSNDPALPTGTLDRMLSESELIVFDQDGRKCEIVQSRCERRRTQNRKAQRAYRARKEAQIKTASTTLTEKQSQLKTLNHHNQELVDTIKRLTAIVVQLEAENQLLKDAQSAHFDILDGSPEWMVKSASFISDVPAEALWHPECYPGR